MKMLQMFDLELLFPYLLTSTCYTLRLHQWNTYVINLLEEVTYMWPVMWQVNQSDISIRYVQNRVKINTWNSSNRTALFSLEPSWILPVLLLFLPEIWRKQIFCILVQFSLCTPFNLESTETSDKAAVFSRRLGAGTAALSRCVLCGGEVHPEPTTPLYQQHRTQSKHHRRQTCGVPVHVCVCHTEM